MLMMTNIGKPYEGKPHVRFDEEGLGPAQPFTLAGALTDLGGVINLEVRPREM